MGVQDAFPHSSALLGANQELVRYLDEARSAQGLPPLTIGDLSSTPYIDPALKLFEGKLPFPQKDTRLQNYLLQAIHAVDAVYKGRS